MTTYLNDLLFLYFLHGFYLLGLLLEGAGGHLELHGHIE